MPEKNPTEDRKQPSDQITQLDIDGLLVDLPEGTMVPTLSRQIEQARIEVGLTMEEMFAGLRTQRQAMSKRNTESLTESIVWLTQT